MTKFKPGQLVRIRCSVQPGPFPNEFLVKIETDRGEISGFVRSSFLLEQSGAKAFILGRIQGVAANSVQVTIPGSFFTTASGLTSVSSDWAQTNLQSVSA